LDWLAGPSREKVCGLDPARDAGSAAPWLVPRFRSSLRGLGHPAALSVVLVTERLATEHTALPVRGTAPRRAAGQLGRLEPTCDRTAFEPATRRRAQRGPRRAGPARRESSSSGSGVSDRAGAAMSPCGGPERTPGPRRRRLPPRA
jgi:hypothetical protein